MTIKFVTKADLVKKPVGPLHQVNIGNKTDGDKSGYLGLVAHVNQNGKAIRIANRLNTERVFILKSEVPQLIEALNALVKDGVPTSVNDILFDAA